MPQLSIAMPSYLEGNCANPHTRPQMPILYRTNSVSAQLSCYQGIKSTQILESGQECQDSRRLLAVTSGLSGSAQHAVTSGKLRSRAVCSKTADVLVAVANLEGEQSSQHLKKRNMSCCLNGTMSAMLQMAFIPAPPPLAAKSWCTGSATTAPRDSYTCIKWCLTIVSEKEVQVDEVQVAHIVQASKCANAILCKLIIPCFHQSGTLPEMT